MFSLIIAFSAVECVIYSRKGMVADKMDENEHIFFQSIKASGALKPAYIYREGASKPIYACCS